LVSQYHLKPTPPLFANTQLTLKLTLSYSNHHADCTIFCRFPIPDIFICYILWSCTPSGFRESLTGTNFVLTIEDKKILKDKYLKDFQTGDRDLRKQFIGNAVRELALLHPAQPPVSKKAATRVCAM